MLIRLLTLLFTLGISYTTGFASENSAIPSTFIQPMNGFVNRINGTHNGCPPSHNDLCSGLVEGFINEDRKDLLWGLLKNQQSICQKGLDLANKNSFSSGGQLANILDQNSDLPLSPEIGITARQCAVGLEHGKGDLGLSKEYVSKFYYIGLQIEAEQIKVLNQIVSLNVIRPDSRIDPVGGAQCSQVELTLVRKKCFELSQECKSKDKAAWKQMVASTTDALKLIGTAESSIESLKEKLPSHLRGGATALRTQIAQLETIIATLKSSHPWISGNTFSEEWKRSGSIENSMELQFAEDKKALVQKMQTLNQSAACLFSKTTSSQCSTDKIISALSEADPIADKSFAIKDSRFPPQMNQAYSYLKYQQCLFNAKKDQLETNDTITNSLKEAAIDIGLTVTTGGLGLLARSSKIAAYGDRGKAIIRWAEQGQKATNATESARSVKEAVNSCYNKEKGQTSTQIKTSCSASPSANGSIASQELDTCVSSVLWAIAGQAPLAAQGLVAKSLKNGNPNSRIGTSVSSDTPGSRLESYSSERTIQATEKILQQKKYAGMTLPEIVNKNARLSDSERARAIKEDFPHLKDTQIKAIVRDVHSIGSQRKGAGVYHYTAQEISEKIRKLKELGLNPEDRRALLSMGYAGQLDESSDFQALLNRSDSDGKQKQYSVDLASEAIKVQNTLPPRSISEQKIEIEEKIKHNERNPLEKQRLKKELEELKKQEKNSSPPYSADSNSDFNELLKRNHRSDPKGTSIEGTGVSRSASALGSDSTRKPISLCSEKINQMRAIGKSEFSISLAQSDLRKGQKAVYFENSNGGQNVVVQGIDPKDSTKIIVEYRTGDPKNPTSTKSVDQTELALSPEEFNFLIQKQLSTQSERSDMQRLMEGKMNRVEKVPQDPVGARITQGQASSKNKVDINESGVPDKFVTDYVDSLVQNAMDSAQKGPEIRKKAEELKALSQELGAGAIADPRYLKIINEIEDLKYQSSHLNQFEIQRFEALDEIPKNVLEFSPEEKSLIKELDSVKNRKKFFSDEDKTRFDQLEMLQKVPMTNRKKALMNLDSVAQKNELASSSFSLSNYYVPNEVKSDLRIIFQEDSYRNTHISSIESLLKTRPSLINHANEDLQNHYKYALSFYQKHSNNPNQSPALQYLLPKIKLYMDAMNHQYWIRANDH